MSETFDKNFSMTLAPVLRELGFERVKLKRCLCPEYLFNNGHVWFSLSWDWRDQYLDVSLGKLFWFKDVMERVVVIGDYSSYESKVTPSAIRTFGSEVLVFEAIAASIKQALEIYEKMYGEIFERYRVSRSKKYGINIEKYIGKEVELNELRKLEV